jgi:hypothetical protein
MARHRDRNRNVKLTLLNVGNARAMKQLPPS